jgi:hypothetical protein
MAESPVKTRQKRRTGKGWLATFLPYQQKNPSRPATTFSL